MFIITFFNKLRPIHMYGLSCVTCMELYAKKMSIGMIQHTTRSLYTIVVYICSMRLKEKNLCQHCFNKTTSKKHINNTWSFWAKRFLLTLIMLKFANSWDHRHILSQKLNIMDIYISQLKVFVCYLENSSHLHVLFLISVAHLTLHAKVAPHYNNTAMIPAKLSCCLWWLGSP